MSPIRIFLLDDEPAACSNMVTLLREQVAVPTEVVGMAHRTADAEPLLAGLRPDALFLDIQMPSENAFDFLARIAPFAFEVVFVTAHEEHAIKALRLNAVDYLLKPIDVEDLTVAVTRVQERRARRTGSKAGESYYAKVVRQLPQAPPGGHLMVRDPNGHEIVALGDVLYLEALGSYSKIHFRTGGQSRAVTMSYSLAEYEEVLPTGLFFRIHKSYLVNSGHMRQLVRSETGATISLSDGTCLSVGRRRIPELVQFLKAGRGTAG